MYNKRPPPQQRRKINATSKVLHPHLVLGGDRVNMDAYESDGNIFAGDSRSPIPMQQHQNLGAVENEGGISGFIRENPIIGILGAAAIGALVYKSISGLQDDNQEEVSHRKRGVVRAREAQAPSVVVMPQPQPQLLAAPQILASPQVSSTHIPGVIDAQVVEVKKKRKKRRKKSATVQVKDKQGRFTSETVKRPKKK